MRSQRYETILNELKLRWRYEPSVKFERIDIRKSHNNQARDEPLDKDIVEQYREQKQKGTDFDAPVLHEPSKTAKFITIDGNHRIEADIKLLREETDAYIVEETDQMAIDRLTWTFNNRVNGKRLSYAETIRHAASFARKYNLSAKRVAEEFMVSYSTLTKHLGGEKVRDVLFKNDIPPKTINRMSDSNISRLAALLPLGEDIVAATAELVSDYGLSEHDVLTLTKEIRESPTYESRKKVIEDFKETERAKSRKAATRGGEFLLPRKSPATKFNQDVRSAVLEARKFPNNLKILKPSGEEYKNAKEIAIELISVLQDIFAIRDRHRKEEENGTTQNAASSS